MTAPQDELQNGVEPFDLSDLRTVALADRPSKVSVADLGRVTPTSEFLIDWLESLPKQLAANALRRLCDHAVRVHREGRLCVCALGGHVVKTGCAPYLIDLMRRGVIGALALNGAAAIHDLEFFLAGKTSEDVTARLRTGEFGVAREPAVVFASAARLATARRIGLGRALGACLEQLPGPNVESSLVVQAYRLGIPCTVHVALGADVVHMHPQVDGADMGFASMLDFRILTTLVSRLAGGLWMNLGCAVMLPEVFLKAVNVARNFGHLLDGLVTANLDMIQHYRGRVNVCDRPGDEGLAITGHHEIMIPLIHAIIVSRLDSHAPAERGPAGVDRDQPAKPEPQSNRNRFLASSKS
jgi:hypothetical protein